MSDGNKFDLTGYSQTCPGAQLSIEEMGNVLLDAMEGTLICLDNQNIILDVSKTVKRFLGFEPVEVIGLSFLLLIEDSERDAFAKFLNNPSLTNDIYSVRMMLAITNDYRQVKIHRKRKLNSDSVDVHSTTTKSNDSIRTILFLTVDDSSYIDITLFDISKQEFYTKINLNGEIIFEDHRGALITGYLPHELVSQSIFNFVHREDCLVKLHALWKCVTSSVSKLQWRFQARNGSLVFLQTEYKLISNHTNDDIIVARNEVMSSVQQSQFDELQSAWRHQCNADIRGNSSSFKLMSLREIDLSIPLNPGECRISVPSLEICFTTNKFHSSNILGNIFDGTKSSRPLTIQDYIQILIEYEKHFDAELIQLMKKIQSLTSRNKHGTNSTNESNDSITQEKLHSFLDSTSKKRTDSDSIVRGILSNSVKYNHEKSPGESPSGSNSTLIQLLNGNEQISSEDSTRISRSKLNSFPLTAESIQQQHIDFMKKYKAAKAKLESQLELAQSQEILNGGQSSDVQKRQIVVTKLSQLEGIKQKHFARTLELRRQTNLHMNHEQKDLHHHPSAQFYSSVYRSSPFPTESEQNRVKTAMFDDFLSQSSSSSYVTVNHPSLSVHSYMDLSFRDPNSSTTTTFNHQQNSNYPF